jgi:hypothetical protein
VRLDTGLAKDVGRQGLCGLYGLVGEGENPVNASRSGASTAMYRQRSEERVRRGLPPLPSYTEGLSELSAAA